MKANFLTPVVTAFDKEGNIDHDANKNIYDYLIEGGVSGIVVMGSTGEFFSMTMKQKKELIQLSCEYINKRTRLLIGTSCMSDEETIELANFALEKGAEGVMIISPYYFALSKESIELFYDNVASKINGNIYIYNFPDRTGYDVTPEITLNLVRRHKNIVGYKDTVPGMAHTRNLINTMMSEYPNFEILSGYDENFVHNVISGGSGCISALSNVAPKLFSKWIKSLNDNDMVAASEIQKNVNVLMNLYDIAPTFIPILKKAMQIAGVQMEDYNTVPFVRANSEQTEKIELLLKKTNII